ncbi:hypothetical protein QBC46DRAFT_433925 [Diplogelasinospora grovesii]|uniref:Thioester reductase (TE) domain-containing protein n=1 Tax=Diplogelasinospora grovesii TaxID=303347 RepID=A0AAN6RY84_9PEZI|nr:hypothetical protein QBC46DRAFT_433925 [Diplogelasinospora grovesii]
MEGKDDKPWTVLLTGSTGSLRTYILSSLQALPPTMIRKIYCLNRSEDAKQKQAAALDVRGLPPLEEERIFFIKATFIHFLMPFKEFRQHIKGVRDFLQFSYRSPRHPPFLYISSLRIAYFSNMHHIPEEISYDLLAIAGGYSQSKYVAERMVEAYVRSTGLPAAVMRVGQIAGPPPREWFPTLLRASQHIGALLSTLGRHNDIDWIPVDILSQIIMEIAEYVIGRPARTGASMVFNIANPETVPFESLLPHLTGIALNTVPCGEWVRLLQQSATNRPTAPGTPGLKLLGLYRSAFTPGKSPF